MGVVFGALACGSSDAGNPASSGGGSGGAGGTVACIPGAQVICGCADGSKAVQICKPDGTGLGECACAGGEGGKGGAAGGNAGAAGSPLAGSAGASIAGAGGQAGSGQAGSGPAGSGQAGSGGQAAGASGQASCPATAALGMLNETQCAALTGPTHSDPSYDGVCGPACGRPSLVFGCTPGFSPGADCVRVADPASPGAWVHCCSEAHCQNIGPGGNCPPSTPNTYVCLYGNKPDSKSCTHQDGSGQTEYLCCP